MFLPTPLPIHIEYFTAYVSDDGRLVLRNDVYGYEHKIEEALGLVAAECDKSERCRAIRSSRDIDGKAANQRFSLN